MKTLKRLATVLLAVMLLATMLVIPANAAGDYTITINGTAEGHTYSAYKIFGGTLSTSGATEGVLSNIIWGNGVDGDALLTDLKADPIFGEGAANEFSASSTAVDVSKVVATWSPDSTKLDRFAELVGANLGALAGSSTEAGPTYTISGLEEGYYLVVDTGELDSDDHDSYTKYILRVVKDVAVTPKGSVPTVTKLVKTDADTAYLTHTDAAITHTIHFQLEGTLPDNYESDYARYYYQFKDTLDNGFTINQATCIEQVYILHSNSAKTVIDSSKYAVAVNEQVLTVTFDNLKTKLPTLRASDKLVVEYNTTLNPNAEIGSDGNKNSVVVVYSNDPNEAANIDPEDQKTGTTPESRAVVYSFELDVTKVDGAKTTTTLPGAQFKVYRNNYNEGTGQYDKVYVVADKIGTGTKVGNVITGSGVITATTDTAEYATTFTSDSSGKFSITGLDANLYHLEEITAPAGYNKMEDPVRVAITPVYTGSALTGLNYDVDSVSGTGDHANGIVSINVRNNAGSTLPSTGGMGTTLFYVVGTGLMLSAAAILLAKKRFARG